MQVNMSVVKRIGGGITLVATILGIYQARSDMVTIITALYHNLLLLVMPILLVSLYFNLKKNRCPILKKGKKCPLGVLSIVDDPKNSVLDLFNVKSRFEFLGEGGNNIFRRLDENLSKRKEFFDKATKENIEFNFVVRNYKNSQLMEFQQKMRYANTLKTESVKRQIKNSIEHQDECRSDGVNLNTYMSDSACKFRVVIVDDVAYVNFYPENSNALEKPLLKIGRTDDSCNLYNWFSKYVEIAKKEIENKNIQKNSTKNLVIKANSKKQLNKAPCPFCGIVKGLSSEVCDKHILASENFIVIPAKGHFVEGYFLILPRNHHSCFADIKDNALIQECQQLIGRIETMLKEKMNGNINVTVFEHGSFPGGNSAGNTIEHAHLHVIPSKIDFAKLLLMEYKMVKRIESLSDVNCFHSSYLYFSYDNSHYVSPVEGEYVSQYLRRIAYKSIYPSENNTYWDWRISFHEERLKKTVSLFNDG